MNDISHKVHIRWQIRRDLPEVLNIENRSFAYPWSEEDFIRWLRQRSVVGMVAEYDERVVGYFIYELHKTRFSLVSMAVHPDFRHQGIGRAIIAKLVSKLSCERRRRITSEVRESNLDAQLFFRACGFRATGVLREFCDDTGEDAFVFEFGLRRELDVLGAKVGIAE